MIREAVDVAVEVVVVFEDEAVVVVVEEVVVDDSIVNPKVHLIVSLVKTFLFSFSINNLLRIP